MKVLSASEFADGLGIPSRTARYAFSIAAKGKPWRGQLLPVVRTEGQQGGASGHSWGVVVDALPPALLSKFEPISDLGEAPLQSLFEDGLTDASTELACWRWSIIREIYGMPGSPQRTALIERITTERHHFRGRDVTVSKTTLYEWMKRYADGGFAALATPARADRGARRVLISRNWDGKIDLDNAAKARVSGAMEIYAKAFLRSDGSLRKLAHIGTRKLVDLCQVEGSAIPAHDLSGLCKLNSKWTSRFAEFKRVARKDRDAKLHFDKDQPRIARHRSALPGQVVFGDVHPVDLWVTMLDSREQVRVRLIAWQDDCTHMLHVTPILFRKGRSVQQSDVIDSFYDLTRHPHFGLPGTLYLDNGGEYGSLFGSFQRFPDLSMIVPGRGVIKAKPYNGPAKGLIEGAFASIERQFIKHLPGYIGGDRTNKKTQSVGKPPAPYGGTYDQLLTQLKEVETIYNDTPQTGRLRGLSPRQALAQAVEDGWTPTGMDDQTFDFVFCKSTNAVVSQGAFRCQGQRYYSDRIAELGHGERLEIRVPLRTSAEGVAVVRNREMLGYAFLDVTYGTIDPAGARESTRRQKLQNACINMLRKEAGPVMDLHEETLRFTDTSPVITEFGQVISIADRTGFETTEQLSKVAEAKRAEQDQVWDAFESYLNPEKREASGGNRQPLKVQSRKE